MTKHLSPMQFFLSASPLFLVLFIDGMGMGLLFPILSTLVMDPQHSILPLSTSNASRNFIYGFTMSIFMFCWFFGAAFLGDLSDKIGRRKALIICLAGAFLSYLLSALAVIISSLPLLIFGRVVAGVTSGSQSIAQAAIIDISPAEQKTRNIGLILFAVSLGFIFGPLFGGFFSDNNLVSWFNFATPLYFAAAISFINLILLILLFHETFEHVGPVKFKFYHAIEIFISAFKHHKVRDLSFILLLMIIGWSSYYSFISVFILRDFHFTTNEIAIFMALMAVGFGVGCSVITNYCSKHFKAQKVVAWTAALTAFFILLTQCIPRPMVAWLCVAPIGASLAVAYSVIIGIFSNQVDEDSQGWVMGITGAIMAFAYGATSMISALLANFGDGVPLIVGWAGLGLSALLMALHRPVE